uniref:Mitochondrial import inner membrane translocase subunit TIM14 n=1 Tax=Callithrix jacchus TaxID=9483 RepID=A0A8I4A3U2_CALJA
MASTMVAAGLTIAAAGFAGRYVLQAMKHMEPQVKQVFQSLPKSAFSGDYYRCKVKMTVLALRELPL